MSTENSGKRRVVQRLPFLLAMGVAGKLLVDTTAQFYNPFLLVIASGVGIGTVAMGRIVALRNLAGLVAPLLGSIADRIGHRTVMRLSLFVSGCAMIVAPATGSVVVFGVAVILTGIGTSGYTPNLHAYLSAKLSYEKRAMGLGIVEYSWALAGILGLSLSGLLIEAYSWKAPFYVIGASLIAMSFALALLPEEGDTRARVPAASGSRSIHRQSPRRFLHLGEHSRSAWAAIGVTGLNTFAIIHMMIIHGGWLQAEYSLSPSKLGTVAMILGFADLASSVTVSVFVDRIGKRKSVIIGVTGMILGFAALPFLNQSLPLAVLSILIPRMFFEFAIVSNFPLLSEQAPKARGKVLSLAIAAGLLGATAAGLTGPASYLKFGVWGIGPVSLVFALLSLLVVVFAVKEPPHHPGTARDGARVRDPFV